MVKCRKQNCTCLKSDPGNLYNYYNKQYESCFQKQNVSRIFSRMTDGMSSSENELKINNWEGFHNWLYCICVVTFDLELGQALEVVLVFTNLDF